VAFGRCCIPPECIASRPDITTSDALDELFTPFGYRGIEVGDSEQTYWPVSGAPYSCGTGLLSDGPTGARSVSVSGLVG
jgi:hypothetical protein